MNTQNDDDKFTRLTEQYNELSRRLRDRTKEVKAHSEQAAV